jgi:hypothetical protein
MEQSSSSVPNPLPPKADVKPIPEELLRQLREANSRFRQGREQVEGAMDNTEFNHQQRINQAEEELRRAEVEVEEVERRIEEELSEPTSEP